MIKKILGQILIVTMLTLGVGSTLAVPRVAHAACNLALAVVGNSATDCIFEIVTTAIVPVTGKFLQLSAYLFDHALTLNMNIAQYLQKPTCTTSVKDCAVSPIEVVWRMIRDISGMFFIFILMWASIKMILGGENSKGVIVGVITAGLLVNFSLFATKVVIDASNALTLTVYRAISPEQHNVGFIDSTVIGNFNVNATNVEEVATNNFYGKEGTISSKIMQVVELQSIFASTKKTTETGFAVSSLVILIGGTALMLVLGLALLAAAVMFIWRFIALLALMAFSPVPALAYGLPGLKTWSDKFIKTLMEQAFFAPIFLFYIYIALKILTNKAFIALSGQENNNFANILSGVGTGVGPLVQYSIVIVVIFYGLSHAKGMGAKGADWGMSTINSLGKWGQNTVTGIAGRNTIGLASKAAGKSFDQFENSLSNSRFKILANTDLTRGIRSTLTSGAKAKYGGQSIEDRETVEEKRQKELTNVQRSNTFKAAIGKHLTAAAAAAPNDHAPHEELKKELSKLGVADIITLGDKIYDKKLASQLSSKQAEGIINSDKMDESDKDKFKQARADGIADRAKNFKYSDIEDILKEQLSADQKKQITDARERDVTDVMKNSATTKTEAVDLLKNYNGKELTKMIEKNKMVPKMLVEGIKIAHLKDMESLDSSYRAVIARQINSLATHDAKPFIRKNSHIWS